MKGNRPMSSRLLLAAALSLLCVTGRGDGTQVQATALARCDKEVRDCLKVLEYIRSAAGPQISTQVAAGYVDEKSLREVQEKAARLHNSFAPRRRRAEAKAQVLFLYLAATA